MWSRNCFFDHSIGNSESSADRASVNANPVLINSLTGLLLTLCCSSAVATRYLLRPENRLASTIATLLLHTGDGFGNSTTLPGIFRLLEVIIFILGEGRTVFGSDHRRLRCRSSCNSVASTVSTITECDGEDANSRLPSLNGLEMEATYRKILEAIKAHDKGIFC